MTNVIGYARVSRREQNPAAQEAELRAAGAIKVFVDHGESSRIAARPQWVACLDYLREGDTLLVRRLDRLGGSERIILDTLNELRQRGIDIRSLTEPQIDTTTPMGRALFGIVAVFAELRIDTIRENTQRGMDHARAQGKVIGRPSKLDADQLAQLRRMREEDGLSFARIGNVLGVDKSTASRAYADLIRYADQPQPATS
ncbi:MAG: resolvase [Microbacterium sp.]|nr:resolvase [Microbacterium sp.]|tara:strand:- start:298 stop:897 length:600 start_codon:yes stop_codon:yes gene_type:complete